MIIQLDTECKDYINDQQQQQMNIQKLGQIYENVQILIALKNQQLIIHAWIELKKIKRRMGSQSSRMNSNGSIYTSKKYRSSNNEESSYQTSKNLIKNRSLLQLHEVNKEQAIMRDANIERGQMKSASNKSPSGKLQYFIKKTVHKHQGQQIPRQYEKKYQFQDSEQFEDVVLDRLNKLQENINKMMREKKIREKHRGYMGSPVNLNKYERKDHIGSPPLYHKNTYIKTGTVNEKDPRRVSQINPISRQIKKHSFAKIATFNKLQQSDDKSYKLNNTKNQQGESQVNINKIKRILQNDNTEEQTFRQEIIFLNSDRRKWEEQQQRIKGIYSQQFINMEDFIQETESKQSNLSHFIEGKSDDAIFNQYKELNIIKPNSKNHIPMTSKAILQNKTQSKGLTFNRQFIKRLQRERRNNDKNIVNQSNFKLQDSKLPYCAIATNVIFYPSKSKNISFY